jgi:hypothetical protein
MGAYNFGKDDLTNASLCVWKEAPGDGHAAMNAVDHVIFNRVGAAGARSSKYDLNNFLRQKNYQCS